MGDHDPADFVCESTAPASSTVCSVVEVHSPMVWLACAADENKHNGGSHQTERGVHEEGDPDAVRKTCRQQHDRGVET